MKRLKIKRFSSGYGIFLAISKNLITLSLKLIIVSTKISAALPEVPESNNRKECCKGLQTD